MKKLFLVLAAAFAMVACQTDINEVGVVAGGEVDVTFEVGTPTRAYSDGTTATVLQYAVYEGADGDATLLPAHKHSVADNNPETISIRKNIPLKLVTGNTYTVIFWAAAEGAPYNVTFAEKLEDAEMEVVYTGALSNDENRDAFYAAHTFTVKGAQTETIELRRPFAQLNIGTSDYTEAAKAGYTPNQSYVKVTSIYNTLNLWDGKVSGDTVVEFAYADIKRDETFPVAGHEYLAMNYLLVNGKETVDVEFAYKETSTGDAKTRVVGSVPVQRNHRTNIYGQLLTSDVEINVEIKPAYDEPAYELDALHKAALNGGEITLTEDVVLTTPLEVMAAMTINLNGKTIKNPTGYAIENYSKLTIEGNGDLNGMGAIRSHGGKVTINGGTFTGTSNWSNGTYQHLLKAVDTEVVINGGTFDATIGGTNNAMINVSENSVVTINGGTFKNVNGVIPQFAPYMFTYEKNGKLVINGGEFYGGWRFNGETATTDIYGGNFTVSYDGQSFHANSTHVLKIYGGVFSLDNGAKLNPANHLAAGYKAVEKDGKFYVVAEDVDVVATTATEVMAALKVADQTISLAPAADGTHKLEGKMSLASGVSLIGLGSEPVAVFNDWGSNAFAYQANFANTTVANINFTNNLVIDAGIANGDVLFKDCVFGGDRAHQGVHFDSGNATIVFDGCTFVGRNMFGASLTKVVFNNCTFLNKKSSLTGADKWTGVNMWGKYEFNNCVFDTDATCNVKCDGVEATFTNCKYVDNRDIATVIKNSPNYTCEISFK